VRMTQRRSSCAGRGDSTKLVSLETARHLGRPVRARIVNISDHRPGCATEGARSRMD
jgi:hypothetical protein